MFFTKIMNIEQLVRTRARLPLAREIIASLQAAGTKAVGVRRARVA